MQDTSQLRHTLRTPLNHIIGYSEMLMEESPGAGDSFEPVLREIHTAAHKLLQSVTRLVTGSMDEEHSLALRAETAGPVRQIQRLAAGLPVTDDSQRILSAAAVLEATFETMNATLAGPRAMVEATATRLRSRLLVVDDDEGNRDILTRQLDRLGYRVESAVNGKAAMRLLREEPFDLMLLDIVMPEMDGFEVLAALKMDGHLKHLPVIVISALDEMQSVARCMEMGADDFLAKPFDRVLLRSRLSAVLKRREAERERIQLAERFRLLLESTGEGIFGIDPAGDCTFINASAARMLGYSREYLLGRAIHDLIHDGHKAGQCPMMRAARDGSASTVLDDSMMRADRTAFPAEYSSNPIFHDGAIQGAVITFSDVSERKRTEERFRQTAKLESLGVLAGGVAHDFNNLLTGVMGNASLVLDSASLSEFERERLKEVLKASERAADLTQQMLAYAGKGRYETQPLNLSKLVKESTELIHTLIPRTVTMELKLESRAKVEGDRSQIQQVVMNLVINAGEAIGEPNPGVVSVKTEDRAVTVEEGHHLGELPAGAYVLMEVSDTGAGMSPEIKAKIFDPFFTTKFTGRGLGLAAVLGIVKSHRGAILVESEEGKGTCFRVYLPVFTGELNGAGEDEVELEAAAGHGLVMLVDDEPVVRESTRAILEDGGYRIAVAEGGAEAVAMFKERAGEFSLILLDMMMPGMSGDQVFRYLRLIRPDIPIIISSGYSEGQVMKYFPGRTVSAFIQKPYTRNGLLGKMATVLAG